MVQRLELKMKEQKGFTLIELLAVIVILGIIAAIAIPAIGNVIKKSDDKSTVQEGIQIINAAKMYVADHPNTTDVTLGYNTTPAAAVVAADGTVTTPAKAPLKDYLDHVKDNTFVVNVTHDTSTGKYTYSLTTHASVSLVDGDDTTTKDSAASENELIKYTN